METEDDLMPCPECGFIGRFYATIYDEDAGEDFFECPDCGYKFELVEEDEA